VICTFAKIRLYFSFVVVLSAIEVLKLAYYEYISIEFLKLKKEIKNKKRLFTLSNNVDLNHGIIMSVYLRFVYYLKMAPLIFVSFK